MNASESHRFHRDLAAALSVRVPLDIGSPQSSHDSPQSSHGSPQSSRGSQRLTLAKLKALEKQIEPCLTMDDSRHADAADTSGFRLALRSNSDLPLRYRAALETFQQTHTMLPVLEGLTTRTVAQSQATRVLRWAFIYLMLVFLIALVGLILFGSFVAPSIENMRADLHLRVLPSEASGLNLLPWLPTMITALGVLFGVMLLWLAAGGAKVMAMWLGGRHYVRCRTTANALRTVQVLLNEGTPVEEAVSVACDLVGVDDSIRSIVRNAARDESDGDPLDSLADFFSIAAVQRLSYMRSTTPVALIAICGGAIGLMYCLALFSPVIGLLRDLGAVAQ